MRHDDAAAFHAMDAAVAVEDSQRSHLQPTLPPIPAHELYGRLLLDAGEYDEAAAQFRSALKLLPTARWQRSAPRAFKSAGDRSALRRGLRSDVVARGRRPPGARRSGAIAEVEPPRVFERALYRYCLNVERGAAVRRRPLCMCRNAGDA